MREELFIEENLENLQFEMGTELVNSIDDNLTIGDEKENIIKGLKRVKELINEYIKILNEEF